MTKRQSPDSGSGINHGDVCRVIPIEGGYKKYISMNHSDEHGPGGLLMMIFRWLQKNSAESLDINPPTDEEMFDGTMALIAKGLLDMFIHFEPDHVGVTMNFVIPGKGVIESQYIRVININQVH
ncbi:hypothetical protein AB3480_00630 [Rhizobium mongolense]|uniref:hypothetical protein n=1 Tax=Rhizobium mongolense TaxID=57676 RepID=UPI0034A438F9